MEGTRRAGLVAAIYVAGAAAALAGSANAGVGIKSEVTIKQDNGGFRGKVKSEHTACEAGRDVKVFRVTPGKDDRVGIDIADAQGNWEAGNSAGGGKFYAKVNKFEVCKPAKSKTITVADTR